MAIEKAKYKELLDRASDMLAHNASPAARSNIKDKLAQLSSELLLEWLVGDKRFESQGQQTEYWLSRFYEEVFADEQPDAIRIYERFDVSLPRATYLARLLRARRKAQWRQAARLELKAQLGRYQKRAETERAKGQAHIQEFDVSLSPGAADELRVMYDRIAIFVPERESPKPPKVKASFGNSKLLGVPAETLLAILEILQSGDGQ